MDTVQPLEPENAELLYCMLNRNRRKQKEQKLATMLLKNTGGAKTFRNKSETFKKHLRAFAF
jgi:hypothetical protein